ncbi:carbohydrate porin [Pseudomonas sp. SLFW]|uniref:carbohydrate porin n=1 Tax=Pseudomonas sp. SLFW TaxID=2683259 RepID=UPI0014123CF6|nr:carbohydrate porin [Pseudomonas sp. SLFW]NBB11098.1 porin [Pseudomonas sp. SLFW]
MPAHSKRCPRLRPFHHHHALGLAALSLAMCAQATPAFDSESPWMLGDWGGKRTELSQQGYDFKLDTVVEVGSNLHGGYDHDKATRYADQFALGAHMDLQKIFGWHDAEFQVTLTNRNGDNISNDRVGDPRVGTISSSQEVWGRGNITRLTDLWYQQKFLDQKLSVKVGRFNEGEDFNTFPCDFQNLALCGSQVGNWGGGIWYNWPVSQWAMRVKYQLTPELFVQVGAFEQNPSNLENDNAFKLSGSGTQGAVLPVELVWAPKVNDLPGEYRLGYYYSTADSTDVYKDSRGRYAALSGENYASSSSKHGLWLTLRQQVTSQASDNSRGLSLFANGTLHDKKTNMIDNYVALGATYTGPFDARPKDDLGLAVGRIHVNPAYRKNTRLLNQANDVSDYNDPAFLPVQDTEYNAELYYGVHVANWLTVRPNLQFIRHPGGVNQVDDALVAGLKIQSSF